MSESSYEPTRAPTSLQPNDDCAATDTTDPDIGTHKTTASNADTITKDAVRGDEQQPEVTLPVYIQPQFQQAWALTQRK